MTPLRSSSVCQASMRSSEFIHMGMMKIVTIKPVAPTFIFVRISASG